VLRPFLQSCRQRFKRGSAVTQRRVGRGDGCFQLCRGGCIFKTRRRELRQHLLCLALGQQRFGQGRQRGRVGRPQLTRLAQFHGRSDWVAAFQQGDPEQTTISPLLGSVCKALFALITAAL
jgi:hypothetical protein